MFCERYNCIDLLLVLDGLRASAFKRGWRRHHDAQDSTATPTYVLFPSLSSRSVPLSTSMNRQAMVLDGTTWPSYDRSWPSYTCCDINSPICGGIRSRETSRLTSHAQCVEIQYMHIGYQGMREIPSSARVRRSIVNSADRLAREVAL
jgi:hypothetical protein